MGRSLVLNLLAAALVCIMMEPALAGESLVLKSEKDMVSYGIGVNVVRNFNQQGMKIDLDLVIRGMKDALAGKLLVDDEVLRKAMVTYQVGLKQQQTRARQAATMQKKSEDASASESDTRKSAVQDAQGK